MDCENVENIVFEGGGMKAVAFCGAIRKLDELGVLKKIKRTIGTSAGALYATTIACKANADTIEQIVKNTDFSKLRDDSWGILSDIWRILNEYGYCKGDALTQWYHSILNTLAGNAFITFGELFEQTKIELVITATNVNCFQTTFFSHKTYPELQVALALRMSTSIPLFFKPVRFAGDYYVDGGLTNNYPIWYFGDIQKTIGLKMMDSNEKENSQGGIDFKRTEIKNMKDFGLAVGNMMLYQIEREHIHSGYWERTIPINTGNITATEFDLKKSQIGWLIEQGYKATSKKIMAS